MLFSVFQMLLIVSYHKRIIFEFSTRQNSALNDITFYFDNLENNSFEENITFSKIMHLKNTSLIVSTLLQII